MRAGPCINRTSPLAVHVMPAVNIQNTGMIGNFEAWDTVLTHALASLLGLCKPTWRTGMTTPAHWPGSLPGSFITATKADDDGGLDPLKNCSTRALYRATSGSGLFVIFKEL